MCRQELECDFLISAIGVEPNTEFVDAAIEKDNEGYLVVDTMMRTSCEHVFAAGDCCKVVVEAAAGKCVVFT